MGIRMIRTYTELSRLQSFGDRFRYLMLCGAVSQETFGFDRYLNQKFYSSPEWKRIRRDVIIRDNGCDLGVEGFDIYGKILIHHRNPITKTDISFSTDFLMNPEYLICVSMETHNAIHYGDVSYLDRFKIVERAKNDTCPWKG